MAKTKIQPIKLILTGIIWFLIYGYLLLPVIGYFLNFNFLSAQDWEKRYTDFLNYKWRINTLPDTLLLFMMIAWIPLWFWGWHFFYHLNWKKLKPKIKVKKATPSKFELKESKPIYHMPRKMPSTMQINRYVAPRLPNQKNEVVSGEKSHANLAQMIKQAAALARKYKVEIFQHILLEGFRVPMAISTDARAVLIEIVNKKKVNWSVEFTDDVTAGGWYSEGGVMERLAQDLIGASKSLAKSEPNSEVLSAILVTDGRVLNTKQAVEYFRSKGIFLLGFNNAEPKEDLPDLASFLSAYFDLKDGETDPAPHPVEKVPLKSKQAPAVEAAPSETTETESEEEETQENSAATEETGQKETSDFDEELEKIRESLSEITNSSEETEEIELTDESPTESTENVSAETTSAQPAQETQPTQQSAQPAQETQPTQQPAQETQQASKPQVVTGLRAPAMPANPAPKA